LVVITVVEQPPDPATNAVFDTAVVTETIPTTPVIVNVNACPSPRLAVAIPLQV
jgi:hypothetical protein